MWITEDEAKRMGYDAPGVPNLYPVPTLSPLDAGELCDALDALNIALAMAHAGNVLGACCYAHIFSQNMLTPNSA